MLISLRNVYIPLCYVGLSYSIFCIHTITINGIPTVLCGNLLATWSTFATMPWRLISPMCLYLPFALGKLNYLYTVWSPCFLSNTDALLGWSDMPLTACLDYGDHCKFDIPQYLHYPRYFFYHLPSVHGCPSSASEFSFPPSAVSHLLQGCHAHQDHSMTYWIAALQLAILSHHL